MGERLNMLVEAIGGREQAFGIDTFGEGKGKIEGSHIGSIDVFGAIGVRAQQRNLTMPQGSEVEFGVSGHTEHNSCASWASDVDRQRNRCTVADGIDRCVRSRRQARSNAVGTRHTTHSPRKFVAWSNHVSPKTFCEPHLVGVTSSGNNPGIRQCAANGSNGTQSHCARTENGNDG